MAYFDLNVTEQIGIGRIKVIAKSGKYRAEYEVELDVRLPNPRITKVIDAVIEPGQSWTSDYTPVGMTGTNNGVVELSSIPPLNLERRLKYLIRYPHGCIEQTTSSVFPQLYLSSLIEVDSEQKKKITSNIKAAIDKIKTFQQSNGALSYWPGQTNYYSDWGTNYAGHFMIEAKSKGYSLPIGFLKKWVRYQKRRANEWDTNLENSRYYYRSDQLIQAYRLYTLALANQPALGAMNRMREITRLSTASKWRLAAAYQLAGRENAAREIVNNLECTIAPYRELSYSYGSNVRDQAMILETLIQMGDKIQAKKVFDDLSKSIGSSSWYSTQTTAYSLMAIAKFVGTGDVDGSNNKLNFDININNESRLNVKSETPISQRKISNPDSQVGNVTVKNNGSKTIFVKIQLDGIPVIGDETDGANNLSLNVTYLDMEGNPINPSTLYQGTDFVAQVKVKHTGIRNDYKEMAITHIFPSGWEIRNLRMDQMESSFSRDEPKYQDIRDDRVMTYFDLKRGKSKTFTVLLNAAYLGKFYLPTVYCEAMYDNEINAHKAGMWIEVKEQGVIK